MNPARPTKSTFILLLTGQIETAEFPDVNNIYCKYNFVFGPDWKQVSGIEEGLSATCERGSSSQRIVLNTPLEATFSSTNPFRWPQLVISCYGRDRFGNDVIRGYGSTFVPTVPGRSTQTVPVFAPQASTLIQKILSFFTGRRAEFVDPRIVSMAQGREVTRVTTQGFLKISFNVVLKDLKKYGYDTCAPTLSRMSEYPLPNFEEEFNKNTSFGHLRTSLLPTRETTQVQIEQESAEQTEQSLLPQTTEEAPQQNLDQIEEYEENID